MAFYWKNSYATVVIISAWTSRKKPSSIPTSILNICLAQVKIFIGLISSWVIVTSVLWCLVRLITGDVLVLQCSMVKYLKLVKNNTFQVFFEFENIQLTLPSFCCLFRSVLFENNHQSSWWSTFKARCFVSEQNVTGQLMKKGGVRPVLPHLNLPKELL